MANTVMTDTDALNQIIDESGLKRKYIAEQLNLSAFSLAKKINNENEFKPSEIVALCNILNIRSMKKRMDIFFRAKVDK